MKQTFFSLLMSLVLLCVRLLVSLRYRIEVRGLDRLTKHHFQRPGGILFLPNHPALMDPVLLEMVLWRHFRPRPLVVAHIYFLRGFRFFMDLVGAMPLPDMDAAVNKWRAKKVEKQFNAIAEGLKKRDNFIIYPSGRLKHTGLELLGGASFAHKLLQEVPVANVVLIRTTGLWGSSFSRALTGSSPSFGKVLFRGAKILLKNGIIFAPRRKILIELELPPPELPLQGTRLELNRFLENWYNHYPEPGPEPLQLVSSAFWKKDLPEAYVPPQRASFASSGKISTVREAPDVATFDESIAEGAMDEEKGATDGRLAAGRKLAEEVNEAPQRDSRDAERPVPPTIQKDVFARLATLSSRPSDQIEKTMRLSHDLGLDSLDEAELHVFLDERYERSDVRPGDLQTVNDVLQAAVGHMKEHEAPRLEPAPGALGWPTEQRFPLQIPEGETIQEVFLRSVDRGRSLCACMDALSGPLSYSRVKIGALALAHKLRQLPEERIGIMLPSSSGAWLVVLGVLLAGKVPVMLNWTAGVRALDHAVDLTGLKVVITSSRFLDRVENEGFGRVEEMFLFVEEIRSAIGLKGKLHALFLSFLKAGTLLKSLNLSRIRSSDPAVILFTSGTESLPKGVPLSHGNLLSNQRAVLQAVSLSANDILYGVLPPFHSFGFSMTGLFPLLMGMRICFAPDPTDSHGMARDVATWKPTLFCCAPSFIRGLFRVAGPDRLHSLRLIVSGAEKTPQELFDYVSGNLPNARLIEGYGITECSPVVTLDRPDEPHVGVGRPIPGVELMILDTGAMQTMPAGKEGEVCIDGPGVFEGYLKNPRNPFVTVKGRRWYLSGDRGLLDEKGRLILSGRLKRFVKIGGEMVSLGGLEEELARMAHALGWVSGKEEGPSLAVSVRERESEKPSLILFTTFEISKEDVNAALKNGGFGRIVKIAEVRTLKEIPLTGTGKTHYRILDDLQ